MSESNNSEYGTGPYYVPDNIIDRAMGVIKRQINLMVRTEYPPSKITGEVKSFLYQKDSPIDLFYEHNGAVRTLDGVSIEKINYTMLNEKKITLGSAFDTLNQDIQIDSIEVTSPNHGYDKIKLDMLKCRKGKKYETLPVFPILCLTSEIHGNPPILQYVDTEFKDFSLLANPEISNRGRYMIKGFGYHRGFNGSLMVDSIALRDINYHMIVISDFKQALEVNRFYSFIE